MNCKIKVCWREQRSADPIFWDDDIDVEFGNVKTGDVTFDNACFEVKSTTSDVISTFTGSRRRRFDNQGQRMVDFKHRFILIKPTMVEIKAGIRYSKMPGWKVLEMLFEWCVKYGVTPIFGCDNEYINYLVRNVWEQEQRNQTPKSGTEQDED